MRNTLLMPLLIASLLIVAACTWGYVARRKPEPKQNDGVAKLQGKAFRQWRLKHKLSQAAIAEATGVSDPVVSRFERGNPMGKRAAQVLMGYKKNFRE